MNSLKTPNQNDDETINQAIEDERLKTESENQVIEYIYFTSLSFIEYFSKNIFQVKIKIS